MTNAVAVRIARAEVAGSVVWAEVHDDTLVALDDAPWHGGRPTGARHAASAARLLAPATPSKIVCVGLNYREHIAESVTVLAGTPPPAEPLLFLKPPSAVIGPGESIRYPAGVTRLDPEAEVGIVIGRRARHATLDEARRAIAGVTCFNDVSARNYQKSDGQWTRAKGFDTFAPLGPIVALGLAPEGRAVECRVNGEVRQRGNTGDLIAPVPELVRHISRIMTLEPGDVIATGTPAGVAPIVVGDRVEVFVEGVGVLVNPVAEDGS
jgi:2-keto-4-pentenoate hydratase/2-oxohepta-3-ene-1,7-dioic acid hydratase in catechol pathway